MRKLHDERIKLEEQFEEERKALLAKYQGLEEPLNASRRSIVVRAHTRTSDVTNMPLHKYR